MRKIVKKIAVLRLLHLIFFQIGVKSKTDMVSMQDKGVNPGPACFFLCQIGCIQNRNGATNMYQMRFLPAGDQAMVVEFGQVIDDNINQKVHQLSAWIETRDISGILELLPTFRSLMIYYDPYIIPFAQLKHIIEEFDINAPADENQVKVIHKIPCCYGARFGKDLHDMEKITKLSREEIVAIHSGTDYKIYMLGFLPGFVYLGGLDKRLEAPRLTSPRIKIDPGSVGIGGNQTGVYPLASPGGWRLIGATPLRFYDPDRQEPILCKAGEYIRFVPIGIDDYYDILHMVVKGNYRHEILTCGFSESPSGERRSLS